MYTDVALNADSSSLDQVRGVLFALSNGDDSFFETVSTQSIKFALARRGREGSPGDALEELYCVGDIQSLGRGRWLPCVTASVPVGQLFVILSGMPTRTLARVIKQPVFGGGSCRLVGELSPESGIGSHPFQWWCSAPGSTVEWTTQTLRVATFPLEVMSSIEYFNHWDRTVPYRWSHALPRSTPASCIVVAREKGPTGTLYFLCRVVNSKAASVQELSKDWNQAFRLGFGLRALLGNSATYVVRDVDGENYEVITPGFLPSPERKVLRALGQMQDLQGTSQILTRIPIAAWPQVDLMLRALGLSKGVGRL
jgi:hypothetical protein